MGGLTFPGVKAANDVELQPIFFRFCRKPDVWTPYLPVQQARPEERWTPISRLVQGRRPHASVHIECPNVKKQSQMCKNNLKMTLHRFYMYRGTRISGACCRSRRCSSREFTSAKILALRPGTRKSNLGLLLRSFERNGKTCIQPCRATTNICPPARGPDAKKGPSQSVPKREAASFLPLHHCYVVHSCCTFQNNDPLRIGKEMCLHCSLAFPNSEKTFVKKKWSF